MIQSLKQLQMRKSFFLIIALSYLLLSDLKAVETQDFNVSKSSEASSSLKRGRKKAEIDKTSQDDSKNAPHFKERKGDQ